MCGCVQSLRAKVADGRSYLQNLCVQLMGALQPQSAAAAVYGGQPQATPHSGEALRRLAMLIMGLLKSPAFRNTKDCASPPLCTPASLCLVTLRRAKYRQPTPSGCGCGAGCTYAQ